MTATTTARKLYGVAPAANYIEVEQGGQTLGLVLFLNKKDAVAKAVACAKRFGRQYVVYESRLITVTTQTLSITVAAI